MPEPCLRIELIYLHSEGLPSLLMSSSPAVALAVELWVEVIPVYVCSDWSEFDHYY